MPAALRLVAILPVVAMLAWASAAALDEIRADHLLREAATEMRTWSAAGGGPAAQTWDSVHEKIDAALRMRPRDPASHELMGALDTMRREEAGRMDEGLAHLVKALELRPTSPHAWAHLVGARYARGESGANLELAITRAVELGPSEPGVQRLVVDYGLAVWREIGPPTQAAVDRMLASGMRRNPLEMLRISEGRDRLAAACRHAISPARRDPRVGRYCERWEITP